MNKKILIALLFTNTLSYSMCCRGSKPKPQMQNPKAQLMRLIEKSDIAGIRSFTQSDNVACIDEEACKAAKIKFENTKISNPSEFATCNEFLVMTLVQALAPDQVKEKLGLPH